MKTAILTTGGTIESEANTFMRQKIKNESYIHKYIKNHTNIDSYRIMNKLSENMMPTDWIHIAEKIKDKIDKSYKNIIVTHGTDTMIYTAAAVKILFGDINERIIFTGAMKGPDDENSDAYINIISSIKAVEDNSLTGGVYIALRSNESVEKVYLHKALSTKPPYMDSMGYESLFGNHVGVYKNNTWNWNNTKSKIKNIDDAICNTLPPQNKIKQVSNDIAYIQTYPGLKLKNINENNIIISTYHSGTSLSISYKNSLQKFIKENSDKNILLVGFSRKIIKNIYESSYELQQNGAILIEDIQPHVLYVAICIGLSLNLNIEQILEKFSN